MKKVKPLYELFVLGKLAQRAMHGYLIHSIVNAALGPSRRLSWGTLYPLLSRLEEEGYIEAQPEKSPDGRGTKSFRTTAQGRARFQELMKPTGRYDDDSQSLFRVRLSNFGLISIARRRQIVDDYHAYLATLVSDSDAKAEEVRNALGLGPKERPYVLRAIEHQRFLAAAEMKWVESLARSLGVL